MKRLAPSKISSAIALLCLFSALCHAETCPPAQSLTESTKHGWKIDDSENGKPLSPMRQQHFLQLAQQFVLAEWTDNRSNQGVVHCFYRDKTGSNLEAYLSKDHLTPLKANSYWYNVSGYKDCAADAAHCSFTHNTALHTTYLARR